MLTAELVRVGQKDGVLRPRYVAVTSLQKKRAARVIEAFTEHVGSSRRALDDALGELLGERTDFKVHKGLVKLLLDRSTFEVDSPIPPSDVRRRLFALAVERAPITTSDDPQLGTPRAEIVQEVAGGANAEEAFSKSTICGTMAPTELGALRAADGKEGLIAM